MSSGSFSVSFNDRNILLQHLLTELCWIPAYVYPLLHCAIKNANLCTPLSICFSFIFIYFRVYMCWNRCNASITAEPYYLFGSFCLFLESTCVVVICLFMCPIFTGDPHRRSSNGIVLGFNS